MLTRGRRRSLITDGIIGIDITLDHVVVIHTERPGNGDFIVEVVVFPIFVLLLAVALYGSLCLLWRAGYKTCQAVFGLHGKGKGITGVVTEIDNTRA